MRELVILAAALVVYPIILKLAHLAAGHCAAAVRARR